jgi:hypothetical protein
MNKILDLNSAQLKDIVGGGDFDTTVIPAIGQSGIITEQAQNQSTPGVVGGLGSLFHDFVKGT